LQRILDRNNSPDRESEAIDRVMCTNYPMELARYRFMQTRTYELMDAGSAYADAFDRARDDADRATAKQLAPFRGKAWDARKAEHKPRWW